MEAERRGLDENFFTWRETEPGKGEIEEKGKTEKRRKGKKRKHLDGWMLRDGNTTEQDATGNRAEWNYIAGELSWFRTETPCVKCCSKPANLALPTTLAFLVDRSVRSHPLLLPCPPGRLHVAVRPHWLHDPARM